MDLLNIDQKERISIFSTVSVSFVNTRRTTDTAPAATQLEFG